MRETASHCYNCGLPLGSNGITLNCGKQQRGFCRPCVKQSVGLKVAQSLAEMQQESEKEQDLEQQQQA